MTETLSMRERIARARDPLGWEIAGQTARRQMCEEADRQLEAMRRPTTPMLAAAQTAWLKDPMRRTSTLWEAMIDAAIREGKDANG